MLKSKAKWIFNEKIDGSHRTVIDHLLEERGLRTEVEKKQFLYPSLDDLADPSNFKNIDKAKERVLKAIERKEKIVVYGDYDADGVTSTALMTKVLREIGADVEFYIPNRFAEGYGLNEEAIQEMYREGVTLIITVDNGIANIVEAEVAKQLGIDLIITDHHEIQEEIPEAYAIIHPHLSEKYEFKHLAGVGIAFQFAHYLLGSLPKKYLDLAAIGTIADLVPLLKENRILAYFGLKQLSKTEHVGLKVLLKKSGLQEQVTERDIGFVIGPRLNAVGRLQDAKIAVDLLLTDDEEEAEEIADEIERLNTERQNIVNKIVEEAEQRVNEKDDLFIILYDEDWHEGVLGIAASRLVNKFHRPVMMLAYDKESNELKGSARSIPAFNLFENCMKIRHLFMKFGGHSQAAGMTLAFEHLEEVKEQLEQLMREQLSDADYKKQINVSQSLSIDEITEELIFQISMFAPFGVANEEPIFHIEEKPVSIRQIGQENNHLKIQFSKNGQLVEALGFGYGDIYYLLSEHIPISIVGKLQINEWNGNRTVQIVIEDIAIDDWLLFDYRGKQNFTSLQYFEPFFDRHTILINNPQKKENLLAFNDYEVITYDEDISNLSKTDILYICDLPQDFQSLEKIVVKTQPKSIYVSYNITENAYLQSIPSRDEFKWLYVFLLKNCPIHLKVDLPKMVETTKWSKDKIIFMLKVFFDLNFISVQNDVITVQKSAKKQDLSNSKTYQQRKEQMEIERVLYYSTFTQLKNWFNPLINLEGIRKEVLNEL